MKISFLCGLDDEDMKDNTTTGPIIPFSELFVVGAAHGTTYSLFDAPFNGYFRHHQEVSHSDELWQ